MYDTPTQSILLSIGQEIKSLGEYPVPDKDDNPEYYDAVIDELSDLCESLVGVSFVVCQTYITSVVSTVMKLHDIYNRSQRDSPLCTTAGKKKSIVSFGSSRLDGTPYSLVQVLDASANYFKHKDEWRASWSSLDNMSKRTAEIIKAAGASEGSTGNLRTLAEAVGNDNFHDTDKYVDILRDWTQELHDAYQKEFKDLGLT